jgi:spore germination protein
LANLEARQSISAIQLAILIICALFGVQVITSANQIARVAHQHAWLSMLLGGAAYYFAAFMMIRLGQFFPAETFVTYLPRVIGKWLGKLVVLYFCIILLLEVVVGLRQFGKIIVFFMFDRTPLEVVILVVLIVSAYAAVQDIGTFIRIIQFFFFTALPVMTLFWFMSVLNFQASNLKPLIPRDFPGILSGAFSSWSAYMGYEIILMVLPLVNRGKLNIARSVGYGFLIVTLVYTVGIMLAIGVLTSATAENLPYPTIMAVRSIELPGLFVERLENYLILSWCPLVFMTFAIFIFVIAKIGAEVYGHFDHRPYVFIIAPLAFIMASVLDRPETLFVLNNVTNVIGVIFSFVIIPLILGIAWWKRRNSIESSA